MNLTTVYYHSVFGETFQQERLNVTCNVGRDIIQHKGDNRQRMSFLEYKHNVPTQKRKIPFYSYCTGFPAGSRTRFFKKERAHNKRCSETTLNSHVQCGEECSEKNAVAGCGTHEGLTSSRYDCFAYSRHHSMKNGLHTSTLRSATIVDYVPFVLRSIPCSKLLSCFCICRH